VTVLVASPSVAALFILLLALDVNLPEGSA
jgi:hypothetical protein